MVISIACSLETCLTMAGTVDLAGALRGQPAALAGDELKASVGLRPYQHGLDARRKF